MNSVLGKALGKMPKTRAYRKAALGAAVLAGGDLLRPHMPQSAGPVTPAQAQRMKKRLESAGVTDNAMLQELTGTGMMADPRFVRDVHTVESHMRTHRAHRPHLEQIGGSFLRHLRPRKKTWTRVAKMLGAAALAVIAAKNPTVRAAAGKAMSSGISRAKGFKTAVSAAAGGERAAKAFALGRGAGSAVGRALDATPAALQTVANVSMLAAATRPAWEGLAAPGGEDEGEDIVYEKPARRAAPGGAKLSTIGQSYAV